MAETTYTPFASKPDAVPVRLIVRRVKPTPGSQPALIANYSYHAFITDREGDSLELEADHRRHAEVENSIRDLKYGVGLNHMPSGQFSANAAWLAVQVIAHNLARWTSRIGLGVRVMNTKTLRRRLFSLAGRLTRSARRLTLHLPQPWPWADWFGRALARNCAPCRLLSDANALISTPSSSTCRGSVQLAPHGTGEYPLHPQDPHYAPLTPLSEDDHQPTGGLSTRNAR